MNKANLVSAMIKKLGRPLTVTLDNFHYDCTALVIPVRYKNKMYLDADVNDLGIVDNGRIVYIGPIEPDFSQSWANIVISVDNKKYSVSRADLIYFGNQPLYLWAVLGTIEEV